jgi:excisionase family DNA binding protein
MPTRTPRKRRRRAASTASTTNAHAHHPPSGTPSTSPPRPTGPRRSTLTEPSTLPDLLTVDEVAELLRTSRKGVYGLIYRGALPGVLRLPGRLLIDRADLVEWLRERRGLSLSAKGEQR